MPTSCARVFQHRRQYVTWEHDQEMQFPEAIHRDQRATPVLEQGHEVGRGEIHLAPIFHLSILLGVIPNEILVDRGRSASAYWSRNWASRSADHGRVRDLHRAEIRVAIDGADIESARIRELELVADADDRLIPLRRED